MNKTTYRYKPMKCMVRCRCKINMHMNVNTAFGLRQQLAFEFQLTLTERGQRATGSKHAAE